MLLKKAYPFTPRPRMTLDDEVEAKYNEFAKSVYESNLLPQKTIELMAFSNSVAICCEHCMRFHYRRAIECGAKEGELSLAVAVAMTVHAGKCRGVARTAIEQAAAGVRT